MEKRPFSHPLLVALFSGILLAILGNYFETRRDKKELDLLDLKSKINQHEKYLDELALASANYYGAVENYILDVRQFSKAGKSEALDERVWSDIQKINFARAPLFASLEKLKVSLTGELLSEEIENYYLLVLQVTTLCQTRKVSETTKIRKILDAKYTPSQNLILYEVQKTINELSQ